MKLVPVPGIYYANKAVQLLGDVIKPFPRVINQKAYQNAVSKAPCVIVVCRNEAGGRLGSQLHHH
jgi:hypothetical protein